MYMEKGFCNIKYLNMFRYQIYKYIFNFICINNILLHFSNQVNLLK